MARIPYTKLSEAGRGVAAEAAKLPDWNIFRMMAQSKAAFIAYSEMGRVILTQLDLPPTLRELAIIRVGFALKSAYEVAAHVEIGTRVGLTPSQIQAIQQTPAATDPSPLSALELAVIRFTDATLASTRPSDEVFDFLLNELGAVQLQQLTLTIGYYAMTSMFLNTYDVDSEQDVALGLRAVGVSKEWG